MNCFSGAAPEAPVRSTRLALLLAAVLAFGAASAQQEAALRYSAQYTVTAIPGTGSAEVALEIRQPRDLLRLLRMRPGPHVSDLAADGRLDIEDGLVSWHPPARGGRISWRVRIAHRRNGDGYDAFLGPEWGLFRAEDLIPRAATRTLKGANSETSLRFRLPEGWSVVTEYAGGKSVRVRRDGRRFDQPAGWIVMGDLGIRRETIAGIKVAVAGPVGQSIRRMDVLALLNWTLPELSALLPRLPDRLTVVSAGDPMWRGGLSGPRSLFLHADRPLISENATSTLVHELLHLALGVDSERGYDWIVEGLAEYYTLEILRRSGTITRPRLERARRDLEEWSASAEMLCSRASTGATTALAVTVFFRLDAEIRRATAGTASLDDVVRELVGSGEKVDLAALTAAATAIAGRKPDTLHRDKLPGCRNIGAAD